MDPKQPWADFGGGTIQSVFSPVALGLVLFAGILILILPRKKAIIPFLLAALLIPSDHIVYIASVHFPMLRILLLFGFARIGWSILCGKGEVFSSGLNRIDKIVILLGALVFVDGILQYQAWGEVIYQLGAFYTTVGSYFVLRFLIRDDGDVKRVVRTLAFITIVVAGFMTYEWLTGRNLVSMALGGVNGFAHQAAEERDGRIRALGVFQHPILAGTFGGFMFPLFIGLWGSEKKGRFLAAAAALGALVMAITSNSSTSFGGVFGGIIGLSFWPLRRNMRLVRWGFVGMLIAMQLYKTTPLWHIIADIDVAGGSSSYHRYMLIDQCIRHFWSWALIGTRDYVNWFLDSFDLSDQYVLVAENAGLIPLVLFLTIIVLGFKYVGRMRHLAEEEGDRKHEFFIWAIGASLFSNVVAFFGISYFDQTVVAWYALLAIITTVTLPIRMTKTAEEPVIAPVPHYGLSPALASKTVQNRQVIGSQKVSANGKDERFNPGRPLTSRRLR